MFATTHFEVIVVKRENEKKVQRMNIFPPMEGFGLIGMITYLKIQFTVLIFFLRQLIQLTRLYYN